jgi:hypothetical protein
MKVVAKKIVGWTRRTEAEKTMLRHRLQFIRYRLLYKASHVLSLIPIPLVLVLRICGTDKHQLHLYGHIYQKLFWPHKYKPIKLLEIGVGGYGVGLGGESLNAWQLYFPFANIIGCDIQDKRRLVTPNTKIYQLDQSSEDQMEQLANLEKHFDIIIDDGSHRSNDQITAFECLYPALNNGGIYIIEDVHTFEQTCVGYFGHLKQYINYSTFGNLKTINMRNRQLAKAIEQIIFEGNLIIIIKRRMGDQSVACVDRFYPGGGPSDDPGKLPAS